MHRALRLTLYVLVTALVAFAALAGYLVTSTAKPRIAERWVRIADMPTPRGEAASTVGPGDSLWVIGGIGGLGRTSRSVAWYSPDEDAWRRAPDLPGRRHHASAASVDGVVYVSGGAKRSTDWTPEANFWALEPGAGRWRVLPPMPEGRMGHQMVAVRGRLYVVGGRGPTARVLIYNPETRTWHRGAPMPRPRDHVGVAVVDFRIYAIGGRDGEVVRDVDVYNVEENAWTPAPPLPQPMSAVAAGRLIDGIHVVGGEDPATFGGEVFDRHYVLNLKSGQWRTAPPPILAVHGAASAVLRGTLVVAGGSRRQGALSVLGWTGLAQAFS